MVEAGCFLFFFYSYLIQTKSHVTDLLCSQHQVQMAFMGSLIGKGFLSSRCNVTLLVQPVQHSYVLLSKQNV